MQCAVDLHIHSCLSPCGDELMTPNNIVKMSMLKGLDLIAVTDHNTARQLPSVEKVAGELGLQILPGMELTTKEEAHMLAYFPSVKQALDFDALIYPHLAKIPNRPAYFGPQQILDEEDEFVYEEPLLLISALDLPVDELARLVREMGGLPVPAHINRGGNGMLNALGFLPIGVDFPLLEISPNLPCPPLPGQHKTLHSSDAHQLENILERESFLPLPEKSAAGFFAWALEGDKM